MPLKSSPWSRPSSVASSRIHVPSSAFSSASASAASDAEANNRNASDPDHVATLVAVNQRHRVLHVAERLAAREQSVEPVAGLERVVAEAHQRLVHVVDQLAVGRRRAGESSGRFARRLAFASASSALGFRRPFIIANFVTFRFSVVTICSAVVAPMPGSVVSHFASCRLIASAISFTGRAIALSAFFAPIFSTVQNRSKNSSFGLGQ